MKRNMRLILGAAIAIVMAGTASAHSFTVALIAGADGAADQMQSAVNGFLVASAENDGHSAETADGHLGGLDVFLIPLPAARASGISGLVGQTVEQYDFAIMPGDATVGLSEPGIGPATVIVRAGVLPTATQRTQFEQTFRDRFEAAPNDAAAQGYNAARRIDQAVRTLGEAARPEDLRAALAATADGISWQSNK